MNFSSIEEIQNIIIDSLIKSFTKQNFFVHNENFQLESEKPPFLYESINGFEILQRKSKNTENAIIRLDKLSLKSIKHLKDMYSPIQTIEDQETKEKPINELKIYSYSLYIHSIHKEQKVNKISKQSGFEFVKRKVTINKLTQTIIQSVHVL